MRKVIYGLVVCIPLVACGQGEAEIRADERQRVIAELADSNDEVVAENDSDQEMPAIVAPQSAIGKAPQESAPTEQAIEPEPMLEAVSVGDPVVVDNGECNDETWQWNMKDCMDRSAVGYNEAMRRYAEFARTASEKELELMCTAKSRIPRLVANKFLQMKFQNACF